MKNIKKNKILKILIQINIKSLTEIVTLDRNDNDSNYCNESNTKEYCSMRKMINKLNI